MTTNPVPCLSSIVAEDASAAMSPSTALDIVHELACLNQLDELETSGDALLIAQGRWQRAALDRLGQILFEHGEAIDVRLGLSSLACATAPDWLCQPERDMDPDIPSNAVRICLDLAQDAALEMAECSHDPALLAGRARQQRALALTRVFLAVHAETFDAELIASADPGAVARVTRAGPDATASDRIAAPRSAGRARAPALN